jgi:tRNA dimethylallyltransferase
VLTGPTGAGKTQLGIELAQRLDAEIISMDSMALYRRMDIGTAKPTPAQRGAVRHHLVDVLEPWESASVAWWLEQAKSCTQEIEACGKRVLFVGGTPLYLKALVCGLFDGPAANADIRRRLALDAEAEGSASLHRRLAAVDPVSAGRIHPNDVRRIIRALEVFLLTGKPMGAWQTQWFGAGGQPGPDGEMPAVLCLDLPRSQLYERINRRVEEMFAAGWLDEARRLRALERPVSLEARKALGYNEVFDLLDGAITLDEAIARVQTRSRNFAKRQITWFRHLPGCEPVTMELTWNRWAPKMNR